jgi:hypothetical protein
MSDQKLRSLRRELQERNVDVGCLYDTDKPVQESTIFAYEACLSQQFPLLPGASAEVLKFVMLKGTKNVWRVVVGEQNGFWISQFVGEGQLRRGYLPKELGIEGPFPRKGRGGASLVEVSKNPKDPAEPDIYPVFFKKWRKGSYVKSLGPYEKYWDRLMGE